MTLTKAEAGRLGGKATVQKHGTEYMRSIAKKGAEAFWRKYTVQPAGLTAWFIVDRVSGKIVNKIGNLPAHINFEQSER